MTTTPPQGAGVAVLGGTLLRVAVVKRVLEELDVVLTVDRPVVAVLLDWTAASQKSFRALDVPGVLITDAETSESSVALSALRAGVDGVIPETATVEELGVALTAVANGRVVLPSAVAIAVVQAFRSAGAGVPLPHLTTREREVLLAMASGSSIKQTAAVLGIAPKTVEVVRATLFRKLGARNTPQAVTRAHAMGLL